MTRLIAALALVSVLASTAPAHAEWWAGLYLGLAVTSDTEVTFKTRRPRTWTEVEVDNSVLWGGRVGYWFEGGVLGEMTPYVGLDLDLSYFRPRIPTQTASSEAGPRRLGAMDLTVGTLTPSVIARYPLMVDQEFPSGRLQPYVAFGPTIFYANTADSTTFGPRGTSESDFGVGVTVRPGLSWQVSDSVSIFAEYRFVHVAPTFDFDRGPVDFKLNSSQFAVGATYRFGK
jgi:opacity protein-like surface antigen